ncbi:aromatic acid exporter family protein [Dubosiella newyorkensis]|uniref:aromatic acid exporter family protein n=1 Tax=Dubosiella newyorkensis TaxID=1862672 RepID=UPI002729D782|nr:aromatic acid exporter family protein [Dubosiella newyorkensis]
MSINQKKALILAFKIGIGSALAVFLAHLFWLENPMGAGTITLLTLLTTKKGTFKLTFQRIWTFLITVSLCCWIYPWLQEDFIAFGFVIFLLVLITEASKTQQTLSVNALIAMHFFSTQTYSWPFIFNEFFLLLIGISIAIVFNLFHDYRGATSSLVEKVRKTDEELLILIREVIVYMEKMETNSKVWGEFGRIEKELQTALSQAIEFQDNTFSDHPQYFIEYFQMRIRQFHILHNLHYEIRKIRSMPAQAKIIEQFLDVCCNKIYEHELPIMQKEILSEIFLVMKKEPLPSSREEFESRALLYHILMDLEDALNAKVDFIESLSEESLKLYRNEKTKHIVSMEEAPDRAVF